MFYVGQVFVSCKLINRNVLEWFLLIMQRPLNRSTNLLRRNHPTLCFWLRREGRQMPNAEQQLLYQTEKPKKNSHRRFYIKMLFLNFEIFVGKHPYEIIKKNYFEEHLHTAASEMTLWSDRRVGISKTKLIRKKGLT